jgi:hypothetical protein
MPPKQLLLISTHWIRIFSNYYLIIQSAPQIKHFIITKIKNLTLYKEIFPVYTENYTKTHKHKMQSY